MNINIFLFIALIFIGTFLFGRYIEKIRVPWIFAALILGTMLAWYNPFSYLTSSSTFSFLSTLGMYFLLFLVGLELDMSALKKKAIFLLRATFTVIALESIVMAILVHYVFGYDWTVSLLVSMSFATVGETILIPILDEFRIVNTSLGQAILGIGTTDDIVELIILIAASILVGVSAGGDIAAIILSLGVISLFMVGLTRLKRESEQFRFASIESLFLFVMFIFFLFVGIGTLGNAGPLAALLAGIALRSFIPHERLEAMESEIRTLTYGFFAPMFFIGIGAELNLQYLFAFPLLVLLVVVVSNGSKIIGSMLVARESLGIKGSVLLGIGLSVRFSTSIIIIKFLYDNGIVGADLFSVAVASSIIFNFFVPLLFSNLLVRWGFARA